MAKELMMMRAGNGLVAEQPEDLGGIGQGQLVKCKITRPRNAGFHRKFFAMLHVGFDAWEPADKQYKGQQVQKQFEQFRQDVTILAGFYETAIRLDGSIRFQAKSIAFGSMGQDEFEEVYSAVANVLLQRVLTNYTREDLDQVVERILGFT